MYWDYQNEFSDAQSVTNSALSDNFLDVGKNAGAGEPILVHAFVDGEDFVSAGNTLTLQLIDSTTGVVSTGSSGMIWELEAVNTASMVDGFVFNCPPVPNEHRRYLALYYQTAGSAFTAGIISACLALDRQSNKEQMGQA